MREIFRLSRACVALAAAFSIALIGTAVQADTFTGAGDGTSWEDPMNWAAGVVPLNNGSGNTLIAENDQVLFDANTFMALLAAGNTQSSTEYRIARLLMGDQTSGGSNGTHSFTLDQGAGITVRVTNSNSAVIGGRPSKFSTVNVLSGITNLEANRIRIGQGAGGSGTVNVSGGLLTLGRGGLELGNPNGTGDGTLNITGGSFTTRNDAEIFDAGVFHVAGSAATQIGIGSNGTTDGRWVQSGILRTGVDAGGTTDILIDDVTGAGGNATFLAGAILDPYDAGGAAVNVWETVLVTEGTITGAPILSASSVAAGWDSRIIGGNQLQVCLDCVQPVPEPSALALLGLGGLALVVRRRK